MADIHDHCAATVAFLNLLLKFPCVFMRLVYIKLLSHDNHSVLTVAALYLYVHACFFSTLLALCSTNVETVGKLQTDFAALDVQVR